VIQNFEGMDETELDEESSKLEAAQNEAQMLRQRIANLESELSEAVDARAAAEASRDEIAASWQYSLAQLEAARREVRALTQTNQELANRIAAREGLDGSNDYSDLDSTSQYYDRDVSDGWDSKSQPRLSIDESIINNNEIKT
jgi:chromosome segregation ATPase